MPKRPNPFGDASPLQYKAHIGVKEVDQGIQKTQNMLTVYEKTRSLLFSGSKRPDSSPCDSALSPEWSSRDAPLSCPMPGQMTLDKTGALFTKQDTSPEGTEDAMECAANAEDSPGFENNNTVYLPPGQMTLTASGQLSASSTHAGNRQSRDDGKICYFCRRPAASGSCQCRLCDKPSCSACLQPCHTCAGAVCSVCSTINYDECFERRICFHCSS